MLYILEKTQGKYRGLEMRNGLAIVCLIGLLLSHLALGMTFELCRYYGRPVASIQPYHRMAWINWNKSLDARVPKLGEPKSESLRRINLSTVPCVGYSLDASDIVKSSGFYHLISRPMSAKGQAELADLLNKVDRSQAAAFATFKKMLAIQNPIILEINNKRMAASRTIMAQDLDKKKSEAWIAANQMLWKRAIEGPPNIDEALIKNVHRMVFIEEEDSETAGEYRKTPIGTMMGTVYISPSDVPAMMADLVTWARKCGKNQHPIVFAAGFFQRIVSIHPFMDSNGRVARLIMDYILFASGYPPAIVDGRVDCRRDVDVALEGQYADEFNVSPDFAPHSIAKGVFKTIELLGNG